MIRFRLWLLVLGLACAAIPPRIHAAPNPLPDPTETGKTAPLPPEVLAAWIDREVEAVWASRKVLPAPVADDAEFLRRVTLDLIGRIPTSAEVHAFLEEKSPDKRRKVVERLLQSPSHANHFTTVWRTMMLPQNNNQQVQFLAGQLDTWLRKRFRENVPYDQLVRELFTAPIATAQRGVRPVGNNPAEPTPIAYYQANELKAENLAASTSRLFLGVNLECAQCHDHPFAKWKRSQFWEYAAFFAGIQPQQRQAGVFSPVQDKPDTREITIPGTEKVVKARFLDGGEPKWKDNTLARETLAEWLTSPENPYFAEAAVNKVWAHFFGIGLIDPIDEPGDDNPPSHPQLLSGLARQFALNKFDLRHIVRAITLTRTYQLTGELTDRSQEDPRVFARMALKGLSAEQLFDSVAAATGYVDTTPANQRGFVVAGRGTPRAEFLVKFANHADRKTEYQTSILQALSLMNGPFIADATNVERSRTLGAVADAPFMTNPDRVEALFIAVLGRKPRPEEADRFGSYVERGGPDGDSKAALADVFWVLLNSSEFIFNH